MSGDTQYKWQSVRWHLVWMEKCQVALGIDGKVSGGTWLCQVVLSVDGKVSGGT